MIREQVFTNNGEIYKETRVFEGITESNYITDLENDPIFTYYKKSDEGNKYYTSTEDFRNWLIGGYIGGIDLSEFDLCPDVSLWCGLGKSPIEEELYFKVNNSSMLNAVSQYYDLPYPINSDTEKQLDETPGVIASYFDKDDNPLVLGSIKFINGNPTLLKLYTIYRYLGRWNLFNKGRVFSRGEIIEEGGMYYLPKEVRYMSTSGDDTVTEYVEVRNDPITQWEARRTNLSTNETKIEHYESSQMARLAIGNLDSGSNYDDYDKAPNVNWWLGRSWIENEYEELYFLVENRQMLDDVASYYGLPVPYDDELKAVLDNDLQSIRFKSYDLNNEGEGNFVAVVVASVTFEDNTATKLKLYETTRWNE